jgi:hypothetical protein
MIRSIRSEKNNEFVRFRMPCLFVCLFASKGAVHIHVSLARRQTDDSTLQGSVHRCRSQINSDKIDAETEDCGENVDTVEKASTANTRQGHNTHAWLLAYQGYIRETSDVHTGAGNTIITRRPFPRGDPFYTGADSRCHRGGESTVRDECGIAIDPVPDDS